MHDFKKTTDVAYFHSLNFHPHVNENLKYGYGNSAEVAANQSKQTNPVIPVHYEPQNPYSHLSQLSYPWYSRKTLLCCGFLTY